MIANISPSSLCYEDTNNTLKYANRAKNIKTTALKNVKHVHHHISEYNQIITELKNEISDIKVRLSYEQSFPEILQITNGEEEKEDGKDNIDQIEIHLENIANHFVEETKLVKRIDELQNKHSLCKLSTVNAKILLEQALQRYGNDHERTRQLKKELEILNKNHQDFQDKLKQSLKSLQEVKDKREFMKNEWQDSKFSNDSKKLLDLQF